MLLLSLWLWSSLDVRTRRRTPRGLPTFLIGADRTKNQQTNDEEEDPTACDVANLAYVRGHNALTIRTRDATFQIADILVIGVITDDGVEPVTPSVQFSLFKIDERGA